MRTFNQALRLISAIVLFFFLWSFGPVWQAVAYAAEKKQGPGASSKGPERQEQGSSSKGPGERFEKTIESIREHINKAEDKSRKGQEPTDEINAIKGRKADIEAIDAELKAEFAATEKRLKDAKLPGEILSRHQKFVAHYHSNLKELIVNLDALSKAEKKSEVDAALKKAKEHLEKTKAPSKHKPLDPNKLPNRMVKAKQKTPRLTPEEYQRDFPKQKTKGKQKVADGRWTNELFATNSHEFTRIANSAFPNPNSTLSNKPVLLAFNETASDVPFSLGIQPPTPQFVYSDSSPLLLAQVIDQPSADDLSETPEVQFTDAIRVLATQLNNSPVKIYEWVRNNIEYAPTYGSIQGADQCLQSKICNDMDTASLLISLLRVSGIYSHYEYSTIEIPIEKAMNWVGGVTDPKMAGTILSTNGIPAKVLISGGTIKAVQLEHVYVKAWIDYIPSRGAVHKQGDTWIPLDPSYKQYMYTQGIDINSAVPFDAQSFANQIQSTATINPDGSVTKVNSALVQQTMQDYQTQVQNYISQNYPNATVGDVIGKKVIIQQNYPILLGTLPYKTVQVGSEFATIPDNLRETMSFSIPEQTGSVAGLTYSTSLPQIAGKKITLSFSPATANDQKVIESLLPLPHADGTPIQPNELPSSFPAYLISLKPELRIDGQVVATGAADTMGSEQSFTMSLNEPGIGPSNIDYIVKAGQYSGIGLNTGNIGIEYINKLKTKLESTKIKLETQNFNDITKEDIAGDLFYTVIATYFAQLDVADNIEAHAMNVIHYRAPSIGMFSLALNVNEVFGVPTSASSNSMMMDVKRIMQSAFSRDGNVDNVKQYMLLSGINSSAQEHSIPEQLFSNPNGAAQGISAVKALQIASNQGISVYTINKSNSASLLPQLQISEEALADIANAVNAGKEVVVSKTNITFNGWVGCGYIIVDPTTGAGAYMIAGNANGCWFGCAAGGMTTCQLIGLIFAVVIGSIIAAFLITILITLLVFFFAWLIASLSAIIATMGAFIYVYLGETLFATLMAAFLICYFNPPPSPPDEINAACAVAFIMATIIANAYYPH